MSAQKGNILVPLLTIIALIATLAAGYFFWQNQQLQTPSIPALTPTPTITKIQDETANWKTYTNSTYGYSIGVPSNFIQTFCEDCNPPEISVGFQNPDKTIDIGVSYSFQGPLCANNTLPCTPINNLTSSLKDRTNDFEEYYSQDSKKFIFSIPIKNTQLRITGSYASKDEVAQVDKILSTFKFASTQSNLYSGFEIINQNQNVAFKTEDQDGLKEVTGTVLQVKEKNSGDYTKAILYYQDYFKSSDWDFYLSASGPTGDIEGWKKMGKYFILQKKTYPETSPIEITISFN